jgi:hypothetical protein
VGGHPNHILGWFMGGTPQGGFIPLAFINYLFNVVCLIVEFTLMVAFLNLAFVVSHVTKNQQIV